MLNSSTKPVYRAPLVFHLRSGQHITATVRAFGGYSVDVQTGASGRVLIQKHAIDLVEVVPSPPAPGPLWPAIAK
jgi:sRNA-binding regulator protein Hfq